ncbi:MAG: LysR family transcriptional regulator [Oscillospiraceae bacterium]|nr:LysR family transcriptional regulator [Oscillospiraceae bacterium]
MAEINMRQIEAFLAVAQYQNFSRAAKALYTSQPCISNWIARMESTCGCRLFRRTNRGAVLTPEGEELYARLDIAYQRFRVSVEEICDSRPGEDATLRIGILNRQAMQDAAESAMREFSARFPDISVTGERFNFHELRDKLMCRELDVIFSLSDDVEPYPELDSFPVCPLPAYVIIPGEWEAEVRQGAGLSALSGRSLIIEAPTTRWRAERICDALGIVPDRVIYVNSYILLSVMIARGKGFSVESRMIDDRIRSWENVFIPVAPEHAASVSVAWNREQLSPQTARFLEMLRENRAVNSLEPEK